VTAERQIGRKGKAKFSATGNETGLPSESDGIPVLHKGLPEKLGLPMHMQGIPVELIGLICKG
jgi:hypothetical protein